MIISASRRTDIPAFYTEWFMNRMREGFVVTQNPFNANQKTKWKLTSDVVDAIVFWTKNPEPMLSRIDELESYGIPFYFQFTLNPYSEDLEPNLPNKSHLLDVFRELSGRIGAERVVWRYDPILFRPDMGVKYHIREFDILSACLEGYTEKAVISFLDLDYKNTKRCQELGISDGTNDEKNRVAKGIAGIAANRGMKVASCAEEIDLSTVGIEHNRCIDDELISRIAGAPVSAKKDKNQRLQCGCIASTDIGMYNTCSHGCSYCYANFTPGAIRSNRAKHNPKSSLLVGNCDSDALDFKRGQKSALERQAPLF